VSVIREAIQSVNESSNSGPYNIIVKDDEDILRLDKDNLAKEFLLFYKKNYKDFSSFKWEEMYPITIKDNSKFHIDVKFNFNKNDLKRVEKIADKIMKSSKFKGKLKKTVNSSSITISNSETGDKVLGLFIGAGSRNKKAGGGKAGISFEVSLTDDLNTLAKGGIVFRYPVFVEKIKEKVLKEFKIDLTKEDFYAEQLGGKNQKRKIQFDGKKFLSQIEGDIGEIVTDVDIVTKKKRIHLSLKYTSQFYLTNFSIRDYLGDLSKINPVRDSVLKHLGFNPKKWSDGYGAVSLMDEEFSDREKIKNLEQLLKVIVGYGYLYVVGGGKKDVVEYIDKNHNIKVLSIIDIGYANEKRKYSYVKFQMKLGNSRYTATIQNRGTTSVDGPNYIRILLNQ